MKRMIASSNTANQRRRGYDFNTSDDHTSPHSTLSSGAVRGTISSSSRRIKRVECYVIFLAIVCICAIALSFVVTFMALPTLQPSRSRTGGSDGFPNVMEPIDAFSRFRKKPTRRKHPVLAGSIRDIIQDNTLDKQLQRAQQQQHPATTRKDQAKLNGAALRDMARQRKNDVERVWGGMEITNHRQSNEQEGNSCDRLFGPESIQPMHDSSESCIVHSVLKWVVCPLPPIRFHMEKIPVCMGNNTVEDVLGRKENQEVIAWTKGMVEVWGEIPQIQLESKLVGKLQRFLSNGMVQSTRSLEKEAGDDVLSVLVFRESYTSTESAMTTLYQAYTILRIMNIKDNFRIIFMDGHASTSTDDAWVKLFGANRVFHLRNFFQATGISTHRRSVVVQARPSALGEEAVVYFDNGDTCKGQSFLRDFRHDLLNAYDLQRSSRDEIDVANSGHVTLLYEKPFLAHPRSKIAANWTKPDVNRTTRAIQKAYKVDTGKIFVKTVDGLRLDEKLKLIHSTGLLLSPDRGSSFMALFLPEGAKYIQFRERSNKRLEYILHTLWISYEAQPLPAIIRDAGVYGRFSDPIINGTEFVPVPDDPLITKDCDDLLSWEAIQANGTCRTHLVLSWTLCAMPPLYIKPEHVAGSMGNESVYDVVGRREKEERLLFDGSAVQSAGDLDPTMVSSCPRMDEVQSFWDIIQVSSTKPSVYGKNNFDPTPTIFVFRDTYANPCWSIMLAYQTWLISNLFDVGDHFRVIWMDGHAYTGIDEFWRDIFGSEVYHFKQFFHDHNIQGFRRPYVVHAGRLALGNEALHRYRFGTTCSSNSTLHDFRRFVLSKYGYSDNDEPPPKKTKNLTLLIRKPYMAHPRADGTMDRMVHDINETVAALRRKYPNYEVSVVSFEAISFREQLKIIRNTDLLVSVHGAGNIHVLFLPFHAQFFEFYPEGFGDRKRFQYIASALGIPRLWIKGGINQQVKDTVEMNLAKHIEYLPNLS